MFIIVILKMHTSSLDLALAALTVQFAMDFSFNVGFGIKMVSSIENLLVSSQRTIEYTGLPQEDELTKPNDNSEWTDTPDIHFNDVYMKYRPQLPPVLKGITHYIKPYEKVGVIGRTGAGKSSIIQAIFRLIETDLHSKILIGGVDIRDLGLH
jgi:ATP-binding cassette subfamily C (CFTR/MRP) protein 4